MIERPILFTPENAQKIHTGIKTQTRRVINPQPEIVYRLTDERIRVDHISDDHQAWYSAEVDPRLPQRRLHGGSRWEDLLANEVQRLWTQGIRGLVCVGGTQGQKGISQCFFVPQQCQGDEKHSSLDMCSVSRPSAVSVFPSPSSRRGPRELQTRQSEMGYATRELDGSEDSQQALRQSSLQVHPRRKTPHFLGDSKWSVQPKTCESNIRMLSSLNFRDSPFERGRRLWIREAWRVGKPHDGRDATEIWEHLTERKQGVTVLYKAGGWKSVAPFERAEPTYPPDEPMPNWAGRYRHARFMPRWASRTVVEITEVRVERLQDISEADAKAEGASPIYPPIMYPDEPLSEYHYTRGFQVLWDSINLETHPWKNNDWVWAISFRKVQA